MHTQTLSSEIVTQPGSLPHARGCLFYLVRGLLALVILLVGLPLAGILYESAMAARDADRYPPPGQLIDVGGHALHIRCVGEGSPPVVLESGANSFSVDWDLVMPGIAQDTRVCAYDRAGYAWSAPGPAPRSPRQIASELRTLLANAGVEGPYVLAGHSNGGKYVRMFASAYPQDVAGMVLVDARHERLDPARTPEENQRDREAYKASLGLYTTLRQLGIARAFGSTLVSSLNPAYASLPAETRSLVAVFGVRQSTLDVMVAEGESAMLNNADLSAASLPENLPLLVLVAGTSVEREPRWLEAQQELAALSANSQLVIVDGAEHLIQLDQPAVVVEGLREIVEAVRTGRLLSE